MQKFIFAIIQPRKKSRCKNFYFYSVSDLSSCHKDLSSFNGVEYLGISSSVPTLVLVLVSLRLY